MSTTAQTVTKTDTTVDTPQITPTTANQTTSKGLTWPRLFGEGDPYEAITWEQRDARITRGDGTVVFEQKDIEVPASWSQTALDIVASKYFRGAKDSPERETSAKQMVDRVANTISGWGFKDGYFATQEDHDNFRQDLKYLLINQFGAFNSPVWFNVGVYERPQCSACFILSVDDNMESILDWCKNEGWIFKYGSGSGTNLSKLRSSKEGISKGGVAGGPVAFMKAADGVANGIKSGGTTRRAAKMVVLDAGHPDIKDFIYCKQNIEDMVKILEASGIKNSIEGELFDPYTILPYQNANNSVRATDEFMKAVQANADWGLKAVKGGQVLEMVKARDVMDWIADAAWHSADPGMQYDTTINDWNTVSNTGRINASNPCSEYMHIDNSACNLASINLLKFMQDDGSYDIDGYKKAIQTFITAQEIIVGNSSYPIKEIEKNAIDFRQLGLGYANLGALLMNMGLAYDSDEGRTIAAGLTSILCGEAYAQSARVAHVTGPFNGYELNKEPMLGVIKKHGLAATKLLQNYTNAIQATGNGKANGPSEGVPYVTMNGSTPTVTIHHATDVPLMRQSWVGDLMQQSEDVWRQALELGEKHGIRNSQATVIAPTGTIAFLMDCATTGIEPALALVAYKKLVGGGTLKLVNTQVPTALKKLGYSDQQIADIDAYILDNDMIEGAPHLKEEHLSVFDCSFKSAQGKRAISYMGHIKMMSATQPFISGAISKTVNMPFDSTRDDVRDAFIQAWKLGLKAIAIYRDGSKSVQPMSTSDKKKEATLVEQTNGHTRIKLPDERPAMTHKFSIGNHAGYITTGMYPDNGDPAETFITIAKEGSTVSGLMDAIATLTSIALQSGVPLKTLVKKFKNMRFEPMGPTMNNEIPFASSFMDYIFTYLGHKFLSKEDQEQLFGKSFDNGVAAQATPAKAETTQADMRATSAPTATLAATSTNKQATAKNAWDDNTPDAQTDAPTCECGGIMFRAGSCYSCPNCFQTTGVCN